MAWAWPGHDLDMVWTRAWQKAIIQKENEERQRDMKDIEGFVKKENADRKKEVTDVIDKLQNDEIKRQEEARSMEDKVAWEKISDSLDP